MNLQRIKVLVIKDVKAIYRIPATLFMTILFPIVLIGAFGLAFGSGSTIGDSTYDVGIVDLDETVWSEYFSGNISQNEVLVNKTYNSPEIGQKDLEQGKIAALIIIPQNFGLSIESYYQNPANSSAWVNITVDLFVDQSSIVVSNAIPPLIQQHLYTTIFGETENIILPVQIGNPSGIDSEHFSQFDLMVPGMFAFTAIFSTMIVAEAFTEQRTSGLLSRIQLTPTSSADIVSSSFISNMITAVFQVGTVFIAANLMGFNSNVDITGILFAFIMVLLLSLCSVGFGLIAASFAKNPGTATGFSFLFILPQMFFGTFVPGSSDIGQFVPSYYVTDALTSILLRGATVTSETVILDLFIMIGFSILVIFAGIAIYSKFGRES
jgi:ABC-2 type transport system permease protein